MKSKVIISTVALTFHLGASRASAADVQATLAVKFHHSSYDKCVSELSAAQALSKSISESGSENQLKPIGDIEAYCLEKFPPPPPVKSGQSSAQDKPVEAPPSGGEGAGPPPIENKGSGSEGSSRCKLEESVVYAGTRDDNIHNDLYWAAHLKQFGSLQEVADCESACSSSGLHGYCTFYKTQDGVHNSCFMLFDVDESAMVRRDEPTNAKGHISYGARCL